MVSKRVTAVLALLATAALASCGGGGGSSSGSSPSPPVTPPVVPPPTPSLTSVRISGATPYAAGCGGTGATLYRNAEVEPSAAVNPSNPQNLIAAWQQDRWSDGGSQGLVTASSFDGGRTWTRAAPPVSTCAGASAGGYPRATDPWVTFAADGTAYFLALVFEGNTFAVGSRSALQVARSTDGGQTWGPLRTLIEDGSSFFNDKSAIAADVTDARFVYAAWDRLAQGGGGPAYFTRTTDGGATWEPARAVYDPGTSSQTIGVLPLPLRDGSLLLVFTQLDEGANGTTTSTLRVLRSSDRGATWSAPVTVATQQSVGTRDPSTGQAVRDGSDLATAAADRSGVVYVAWQDARFSGGARDAVVVSRSTDGGQTWSAPVRASGNATVAAFTPTLQVRADGTIGVSYYDFRNDTSDPATLQTDYWVATSTDALTWTDTHVTGPFSLTGAPTASGLFVGDYQALLAVGGQFVPVFVQTTGDTTNRTDVFAAFGP